MKFARLKRLLKKLPVPFSKNQRYDLLTRRIIRDHCSTDANCIDAGAHAGEVFDLFLKYAPRGKHFAFEPIPSFYQLLRKKYGGISNCFLHELALSNTSGLMTFNYVVTNPAYSGIKKRSYDRKHEKDTVIMVRTELLDNVIPAGLPIHLIKIDVEGAEMDVMEGATRILSTSHPLIIFEFGIGGSDVYGTTPEKMYSFLKRYSYKVSLLGDFVNKKASLGENEFHQQFHNRENYYFIAH